MLNKVQIAAIAAATLLASPAFAGWPVAQSAQAEPIEDQKHPCLRERLRRETVCGQLRLPCGWEVGMACCRSLALQQNPLVRRVGLFAEIV